jgi:uncharacterized membrane protein YqaE (UPF0057 family)
MSELTAANIPSKIDLTPKRHHGYTVLLFIMGTLFPPLAVAARFGIGKDFWLNLLLTVCGYIPGHGHNFYIQNVRNNNNNTRTPKWVQRYGLVDNAEIKRKQRKSQWANRYNDRLPQSALEGQPYEEGQEHGSSVDISLEGGNGKAPRQPNGELWGPDDEQFYNPHKNSAPSSSGRWHYPANFDDVEPIETGKRGKKKKEKKDRWERTQDAYSMTSEGDSGKKKKRKRKTAGAPSSVPVQDEVNEFPEDPEGGLYRERPQVSDKQQNKVTEEQAFNHEF